MLLDRRCGHHLEAISSLGSKQIVCQDRRGIWCGTERSCDRVVTSLTKLIEQFDVTREACGAAGLERESKCSDVFAKCVADVRNVRINSTQPAFKASFYQLIAGLFNNHMPVSSQLRAPPNLLTSSCSRCCTMKPLEM